MKKIQMIFTVLLCILAAWNVNAGNRKANRYFELFRYSKALPLYKNNAIHGSLEKKREATERLADCYRLTGNIREARLWYAKALAFYKPDPLCFYYYGQTLRSLGEYTGAKDAFLRFSELQPDDNRGKILAGYCEQIQTLSDLPENVVIGNTTVLNCELSDFCPVFFQKGIIFVSDRKETNEQEKNNRRNNQGYYDLYYSGMKINDESEITMNVPVKMPQQFNQAYHDGPVSFSNDNTDAYLTRTHKSKVRKDEKNIRTINLQLFHASLSVPGKIQFKSLPFNNENYSTAYATVTKNGNSMIFSSDMPGGYGESDLYTAVRRNGIWSKPENLGPVINSFGNDVFPFLANDSTLYFASDGHLGYGGLDIFVSILRFGHWTEPRNIRKPVNSSYDDFGLVFMEDIDKGFFSSNRPGGKGSDDIYALDNYGKYTRENAFTASIHSGNIHEEKNQTTKFVQKDSVDLWFAVQIFAISSSTKGRRIDFKDESSYSKTINNYTKYFVGRFNDWKSADRERIRLSNKFPGCFVVTFKNNELVPGD